MHSMTSREFNHSTGKAKRLADEGPVYILNRGKPEYVLLSYAEYGKLKPKAKPFKSLYDELMEMPPSPLADLPPEERDEVEARIRAIEEEAHRELNDPRNWGRPEDIY